MSKYTLSRLAALAIVAVAGSATAAHAQNYGYGAPFDWTGFYAGIYGGLTPSEFPNVLNDGAFQGGLVTGFNMQVGPGVIGAELDGGYIGGKTHNTGGGGELAQHWTGAAKLKAGVALDRTLLYATAGYGMARLDPQGAVVSGASWQGGWIVGGGIEQSLGNNLSAKLEYTQTRMYDVQTTVAGGGRYSADLTNHSIKAGLNFRF